MNPFTLIIVRRLGAFTIYDPTTILLWRTSYAWILFSGRQVEYTAYQLTSLRYCTLFGNRARQYWGRISSSVFHVFVYRSISYRKTFYSKVRKKNSQCLIQKNQILVLRRQNVAAPERTGDKTYRHQNFFHQNVDTKKFKIRVKKCRPLHNKENIFK